MPLVGKCFSLWHSPRIPEIHANLRGHPLSPHGSKKVRARCGPAILQFPMLMQEKGGWIKRSGSPSRKGATGRCWILTLFLSQARVISLPINLKQKQPAPKFPVAPNSILAYQPLPASIRSSHGAESMAHSVTAYNKTLFHWGRFDLLHLPKKPAHL